MSVNAPETFSRRVYAVFGRLDGIAQTSGASSQLQPSGADTQWSLARQQVYRAGNEEADSSEEEDDDKHAQQQPEQWLHTLLDAQDGNVQVDKQGNIIQPSLAFCQALDNEQEYDDVDAVAGTSLRGHSDPADTKPNRLTEVLDDNVFERRMRSHHTSAHSGSHADASDMDMDIDIHPRNANNRQQSSFTKGRRAQQGLSGRPPLSGRGPGTGHGHSRVPHHVQHPEKYTCYILDEPLTVGGGEKASGISSQAEQEKAARAASGAALASQQQLEDQEPREPLPAFGTGIHFRPTKKARPQGSSNLPAAAGAVATAQMLHDADDDDDNEQDVQPALKSFPAEASCMDDDFGEGIQHAGRAKTRRRQYRVKANVI